MNPIAEEIKSYYGSGKMDHEEFIEHYGVGHLDGRTFWSLALGFR